MGLSRARLALFYKPRFPGQNQGLWNPMFGYSLRKPPQVSSPHVQTWIFAGPPAPSNCLKTAGELQPVIPQAGNAKPLAIFSIPPCPSPQDWKNKHENMTAMTSPG